MPPVLRSFADESRIQLAGSRLTVAAAGLTLMLSAQAVSAQGNFDDETSSTAEPRHLSICYGHGCRDIAQVGLSPAEWQGVRARLTPPAANPAMERQRISAAIALLESVVGAHTGTGKDIGGTFPGTGRPGQMDCIDEATNTTTYLKMMAAENLLRWHTVEDHAIRGFFIFGWPHASAVIRDTESGERYAVDSWFHRNGVAPEIVPLKTWRSGWRPEG